MLTITLTLELLALGGLLVLSAFFSGTEIALFSLSKLQLRRLRQEHPAQGQIISELLDQPHRLLSTILFGNTVANVGAAILGYSILQTLVPRHAEAVAVPVMTVVILLCGEVTPKTLVIRSAGFFAVHLARPIRWTVVSTSQLRRTTEAVSAWVVQRIERLPSFSATYGAAGVGARVDRPAYRAAPLLFSTEGALCCADGRRVPDVAQRQRARRRRSQGR